MAIKAPSIGTIEKPPKSSRLMLSDMPKPNGGVYNIAIDYPWTFTPPDLRDKLEIPTIIMTEFEQDANALYSQLTFWKEQAMSSFRNPTGPRIRFLTNTSANPYDAMYHAKPTGLTYIFPFFDPYHTRVNPKWGEGGGLLNNETFKNILRGLGDVVSLAGSAGENSAPGLFLNKPKQWTGAEPAIYTLQFTLFNTIPDQKDYTANDAFLKRLRMSVSHSQVNLMLALPPALFTVNIPGVRYSPAATIIGLNIENIGQINQLTNNNKSINVPDAYRVQMTISELIVESRQIIQAVMNNEYSKVTAISDKKLTNISKVEKDVNAKIIENQQADQKAAAAKKTP